MNTSNSDTHLEADDNYLPDSLEIIEEAKRISPEPFGNIVEGNELHEAMMILWLHGFSEDEAGNTDSIGHVFRIGRHVVETSGQGFTTLHSYGTETKAQELIDFVNGQMDDNEQT